jgi:hypothetical protein
MDFSVGWQLGSSGGALWKRHLEIADGQLALDIKPDGRVWLSALTPVRVTVNNEPLVRPVPIGMKDVVRFVNDGRPIMPLELRGLIDGVRVPIGVLWVFTGASRSTLAAVERACEQLHTIDQPRILMDAAERWRVFGLQRTAEWLVRHGVPEAEPIIARPERPEVEHAVRALLPKNLDWADALGCFLSPVGQVFSERLRITTSSGMRGGLMLVGPPPTPALDAAQEHLQLVGKRMMSWATTFDAALAETIARHLEADAAVTVDAALLERDEVNRILTPEGPRHRGDLVAPEGVEHWVSDVTAIEGSLILTGSALSTARFPALTTVGGEVRVTQCEHLVSLDLPVLRAAGALSVRNTELLLSLRLPALTLVRGDVVVHGNRFLTWVSLPVLSTVRTFELTYNDSLSPDVAQPLVARLGGVWLENRNSGQRHPVDAWLPSAWRQTAQRERLRRLKDVLPDHPGLAELLLFDAVLSGPASRIEAAIDQVLRLHHGQRAELSARLLRQALSGTRPLRAERAQLEALTPVDDLAAWDGAMKRMIAEDESRQQVLRARMTRRFAGVYLVDELPPSLHAAGAWLEARVAVDDQPLSYFEHLAATEQEARSHQGLIIWLARPPTLRDLWLAMRRWLAQHPRHLGRETAALLRDLELRELPDE